ncbi:MAG: hypothetical protein PHT80_10460, partial [Lentisphaeria bacterium]|nr:hypothetical protein [Lentisphaeria bacterium]
GGRRHRGARHDGAGQKFIPFYPLIRAGETTAPAAQGQKFIPFYPLLSTYRRREGRNTPARAPGKRPPAPQKAGLGAEKGGKKVYPLFIPLLCKKAWFYGSKHEKREIKKDSQPMP